MIEGSGSVPLTNGSGSRRPKTFLDPTNPDLDPQHCNTTSVFIEMSEMFGILILKKLIILPEALGRFFKA
jgi:hypothetical protein